MLDMLQSFKIPALLLQPEMRPDLVCLLGSGIVAIVITLLFLRFVWHAPLPGQFTEETSPYQAQVSSRKWYFQTTTLAALFTAASIVLLHQLSLNRTAITPRHVTGDPLVSSSLIDYLDGLRTDWGIPGVSIAIVRQGDDHIWKQQTIGLGRKDAEGNQVTDKVSRF